MSAVSYDKVLFPFEPGTPVASQSVAIERQARYHDRAVLPGKLVPERNFRVSIVIPLLDEADSLATLFAQLQDMLDKLVWTGEVLLVDDGSTDGSHELLAKLRAMDSRFSVIRLRRNFGQSAAFSAGFDFARGDVIVTMDGDLQNDAADIPRLLAKIDEGYDIVSGWRQNRHDNFLTRRLPSSVANWLISSVTKVKLHDYGCSLKAYRREVLTLTKLYGEMHRFIPALASRIGVKVAEVPVNHYARRHGRSKYGLGRTIRVLLDLLTVKFLLDYATRPIQIFGQLGLISLGVGTGFGLYLSFLKLVMGEAIRDRPLLFLVVLLIVVGVQLIVMGLLGELMVRVYYEASGKPTYTVREHLGHESRETLRD
jgi:glycosyltransferase involved in cell wall biosynthesis